MISLFLRLLPLFLLLFAGCLGGPPPAASQSTESPRLEGEWFVSRDGYRHPVRLSLPPEKPRALVLALHGFNDYSRAFDAVGCWFTKRGVALYAYDQRGFGQTVGRGIWHGKEALTRDVVDMVWQLSHDHPGVPLFLLGESMGGAVLLAAQAEHELPVQGIILSAPAVWNRENMPWYQRASFYTLAHLFPWLLVSGQGLGITPSDNDEMLRALSRDPLVIHETRMDTLWGLADLMDATLPAAAKLRLPTLVLYGERDEIIPPLAMAAFQEGLPNHVVVARFEHSYHMLLRDLNGPEVLEKIRTWMGERLLAAALPPLQNYTLRVEDTSCFSCWSITETPSPKRSTPTAP